MEQAKTRDKKIEITDIAISKANSPRLSIFSDEQNKRFSDLHKELLRISKNKNDSNEVAVLFNPSSFLYEIELGDVSNVDIFNNPLARDMNRTAKVKELFLLHNHPSTKGFSYSDIGVLLRNDNLGGITVVTNMGDVHILYKSDKYDFEKAYNELFKIRSDYSADVLDAVADLEVVKRFLKICDHCGIVSL